MTASMLNGWARLFKDRPVRLGAYMDPKLSFFYTWLPRVSRRGGSENEAENMALGPPHRYLHHSLYPTKSQVGRKGSKPCLKDMWGVRRGIRGKWFHPSPS